MLHAPLVALVMYTMGVPRSFGSFLSGKWSSSSWIAGRLTIYLLPKTRCSHSPYNPRAQVGFFRKSNGYILLVVGSCLKAVIYNCDIYILCAVGEGCETKKLNVKNNCGLLPSSRSLEKSPAPQASPLRSARCIAGTLPTRVSCNRVLVVVTADASTAPSYIRGEVFACTLI